MECGESLDAIVDVNCVLRVRGRMGMPRVGEVILNFLIEAHGSNYSINLGATKLYHGLNKHYW